MSLHNDVKALRRELINGPRPIDSHRSSLLDDWAAVMAGEHSPQTPAADAKHGLEALVAQLVRAELDRLRQEELLPKRIYRASCALCIELAALHFGIEPAAILSKRRTADLVQARHAAIWLAHKVTGQSSEQIGRRFDRDHSSILHAIQHADEMRAEDGDFEALTTTLISYFRVGA